MLLPGRQQRRFVRDEQSLDGPKLLRPESEVASQRDRIEPELGGQVVTVDVDVRRLDQVMTVEVNPVRAPERNPVGMTEAPRDGPYPSRTDWRLQNQSTTRAAADGGPL